jgi:hypothetical protein
MVLKCKICNKQLRKIRNNYKILDKKNKVLDYGYTCYTDKQECEKKILEKKTENNKIEISVNHKYPISVYTYE